jgi:glutamate synthase domain-containing protein 2/glutamate synthase domain-containing protein 3
MSFVGRERNLLAETPQHCHQLKLSHPVLTNDDIEMLKTSELKDFRVCTVPILFNVREAPGALTQALDQVCREVEMRIDEGHSMVILSDRNVSRDMAAIPSLLAISGVHHYLIRKGKRHLSGLVIETGEAREVHHFSTLIGYGASGINPYLVFESMMDLKDRAYISKEMTLQEAIEHYITAVKKGLLKIMSKMGVSTIRSYRGSQIYEAIGLDRGFIDKYFTGTPSLIGGIGIDVVEKEKLAHHNRAFEENNSLDSGGIYNYRKFSEHHLFSPEAIVLLQRATRESDYNVFKQYTKTVNDINRNLCTLREIKSGKSVPIEEVESVESIVKRFVTSAMSFGSISKEAHETLAVAMNRLGSASNSGEGGEDEQRFYPKERGNGANSKIKQIASARFGVTSNYLVHAEELQIKMAQGAKPGEGGQLPGHKVNEIIARVRNSTPGVMLISPPPHHDIYSIEDLSQLIFDLKHGNPGVKVSEIGLAETQTVLVRSKLRDRIRIQVDGQIKTGRDVFIAALLGAEEFGFATTALVTLGCVMMRKCHMNTCPVGVATQDPRLRKRFTGKPEYVMNFMRFMAEETREYMAEAGFKRFDEMVGRVDIIEVNDSVENEKTKELDFSGVLMKPEVPEGGAIRCMRSCEHDFSQILSTIDVDMIKKASKAIKSGIPVEMAFSVRNGDRALGAALSAEISKRYGSTGLLDDTIKVKMKGSAGMSFGAFLAKGITFTLEGDANDYFGKGLSGGKVIIYPPKGSTFIPERNIITGNVNLFGATSGEVYINGMAGERFCVRNSGAVAVVEGVGDHGCEYMTGGRVIILGETGINFAAGMSGGIAYVLDKSQLFDTRCNLEMVDVEPLVEKEDQEFLHTYIKKHYEYTGSKNAASILDLWKEMFPLFVKVIPIDYRSVLERIKESELKESETVKMTEEVYS